MQMIDGLSLADVIAQRQQEAAPVPSGRPPVPPPPRTNSHVLAELWPASPEPETPPAARHSSGTWLPRSTRPCPLPRRARRRSSFRRWRGWAFKRRKRWSTLTAWTFCTATSSPPICWSNTWQPVGHRFWAGTLAERRGSDRLRRHRGHVPLHEPGTRLGRELLWSTTAPISTPWAPRCTSWRRCGPRSTASAVRNCWPASRGRSRFRPAGSTAPSPPIWRRSF